MENPEPVGTFIENLSEKHTDFNALNFLRNYPVVLEESFCFRTRMGYNVQSLGGDEINILYVGNDPKKSLLISISKKDSGKDLTSERIIPFVSYDIVITVFDFTSTFLGLQNAIRKEQEEIAKRSSFPISELDAFAIVLRRGTDLLGAKKQLEASYGRKCYWRIVRKIISFFRHCDEKAKRQEQIFLKLEELYEALNDRLYNPALNSIQNLDFFAR